MDALAAAISMSCAIRKLLAALASQYSAQERHRSRLSSGERPDQLNRIAQRVDGRSSASALGITLRVDR
jgi:hypothetical protein